MSSNNNVSNDISFMIIEPHQQLDHPHQLIELDHPHPQSSTSDPSYSDDKSTATLSNNRSWLPVPIFKQVELHEAATSLFIDVRLLLILRLLAVSFLIGHLFFFGFDHLLIITHYHVWSFFLATITLLLAVFSSLAHVISDDDDNDNDNDNDNVNDNVNDNDDAQIQYDNGNQQITHHEQQDNKYTVFNIQNSHDQHDVVEHQHSQLQQNSNNRSFTKFLVIILNPIYQTAVSTCLFTLIIYWAFLRHSNASTGNDISLQYPSIAMAAIAPSVLLLDSILTQTCNFRFRNLPLYFLFHVAYILVYVFLDGQYTFLEDVDLPKTQKVARIVGILVGCFVTPFIVLAIFKCLSLITNRNNTEHNNNENESESDNEQKLKKKHKQNKRERNSFSRFFTSINDNNNDTSFGSSTKDDKNDPIDVHEYGKHNEIIDASRALVYNNAGNNTQTQFELPSIQSHSSSSQLPNATDNLQSSNHFQSLKYTRSKSLKSPNQRPFSYPSAQHANEHVHVEMEMEYGFNDLDQDSNHNNNNTSIDDRESNPPMSRKLTSFGMIRSASGQWKRSRSTSLNTKNMKNAIVSSLSETSFGDFNPGWSSVGAFSNSNSSNSFQRQTSWTTPNGKEVAIPAPKVEDEWFKMPAVFETKGLERDVVNLSSNHNLAPSMQRSESAGGILGKVSETAGKIVMRRSSSANAKYDHTHDQQQQQSSQRGTIASVASTSAIDTKVHDEYDSLVDIDEGHTHGTF